MSNSIALEKCKTECDIVEIILVQGFCPLNIEIAQFPGGFCLNVFITFIFFLNITLGDLSPPLKIFIIIIIYYYYGCVVLGDFFNINNFQLLC